ncbi:MAG: radical SAM protein [Anaerolineales bacterium]|nr:radical SAM protein [Anaerolineales bacterium]
MFYNRGMDGIGKLKVLAQHMNLEPAEEVAAAPPANPRPESRVAPCGQVIVPKETAVSATQSDVAVHHARLPNGKTIPLLKTLLTSACERNCHYCPFRAGRSYRRVTFKPEEMAQTFMDLYRAGVVRGLFLSSGIIGGGVKTQDRLLDAVDILRQKHRFRGYVHLKVMPGAEEAQVFRAMQLADRLSVNLEAPNDRRLAQLAPRKQFLEELVTPLRWIEAIRQSQPAHLGWNGRWPSSTTQFVVGGADESDVELLSTAEYMHKQLKLARVYYSRFTPVRDTPLENRPAENPLREHRLYQASFLFRDYDFALEEMPFDQAGRLPLDTDPKLAWAVANLRQAPVEVNRADRDSLLRVPGIGPKGADAILRARRLGTLREVRDLQQIGVQTKRLRPFVLLDGRRPTYQLPLFEE